MTTNLEGLHTLWQATSNMHACINITSPPGKIYHLQNIVSYSSIDAIHHDNVSCSKQEMRSFDSVVKYVSMVATYKCSTILRRACI